jgi:uncharacterized protein
MAAGILRELRPADLTAFRALVATDPAAHCFVAARVEEPESLHHADLWGWFVDGYLVSALHVGANLVPVATTSAARAAFVKRWSALPRRCSSFVGPAAEVLDLWRGLSRAWGPAREVRERQPLLAIDHAPDVAPDPLVRAVREDEIDILMPACIAMFTEEVGISPVSGGAASAYRARVLDLIRTGRAFARIENGRVVFKAEVGAVALGACQVQGVWVDPEHRGHGLSVGGMAAVVEQAQAHLAPRVSLYVNDFNEAARATYRRVGFEQVGVFATILF